MPDVPIMPARRCADSTGWLTLGEGPVWDGDGQRVLWVDIQEGLLLDGHLDGDRVTVRSRRSFGQTVGAVALARDGGLLVAGAREVFVLDAQGQVTATVRVLGAAVDARLNDAVCDPAGRLLVGTLALDGRRGQERVVSIGIDRRPVDLVTGLTLANGMGFSPDGSTLYLVDSVPGAIHAFDYDVVSGSVGSRRTVWTSQGLIPDGLTVDADGNLWVAYFGGGEVQCLTPEGEVVGSVIVPAPNTTCPAFVGTSLDLLLVTTAREQLSDEQLLAWPDSGELFVADVGVAGLPAARWAGSTVRKTVDHSHPPTPEETLP